VANDTAAAVRAVSRGSVERYALLLDLALHGDMDEVDSLLSIEKMQSFSFA